MFVNELWVHVYRKKISKFEPFSIFYELLLYHFLYPKRKACSINYIFATVNFCFTIWITKTQTYQWYVTLISASWYICTIVIFNQKPQKGTLFMKMPSSANFFLRTSCNWVDWKLPIIFSLTKFYPEIINI